MKDVIRDIGYLLAGIPSATFTYHEDTGFQLQSGVTIKSLSPECFESYCQEYLRVGWLTKRLELFCEGYNYSGQIVDGFVAGLKKFLRVYTNSILTLSKKYSDTLGELSKVSSPLMTQISFLGKLCLLETEGELLPNGVSLISRILDSSVHVCDMSVNLLLTSILSSSSGPYLRFLRLWLFSGKLEGNSIEFGVEIDPHYINARDETYWKAAYNLIPIEGSSFLSDIQQKVHLTGKSLALLILICPDHFLAGLHRDIQPSLHLAVTADQQATLQELCRDYETKMTEIANTCSESYSQKREKLEREKIEKMEMVLMKNKEEKILREQREKEAREEKLKRQQELRNDLLEQAKAVEDRRKREAEEKKLEDKRIQEEADKMEEMVRQREAEEKRRMEEFYAKLNAEAEMREKRAEWRMKRADPKLQQKRQTLFHQEQEKLKSTTPLTTDTVIPEKLKVELDDLGNVSVMVEDQEGNIVSEVIEDLGEIEEEVKSLLTNDNFESLPDNTKNIICEKINQKTNLAFPNINSRSTNKGIVLGSNIEFNYETETTGLSTSSKDLSKVEVDNTDGVARKKSSHGQQIERLLYPHRFDSKKEASMTFTKTDFHLSHQDKPVPYTKSFTFNPNDGYLEMGGPSPVTKPADSQASAPLTLILQNSILIPLRVQSKLVDSALLNHMLVDRQLTEHFAALRNYLLLADGEFGRQLVMSLCQLAGQSTEHPAQLAGQLHSHLQSGGPAPLLLSPATLNRVLDTAISSSTSASADSFSRNLTFLLDTESDIRHHLGIPGLSLTYQASWPDNIVLSMDTVSKYSLILDFQLELRLAMLSLELDWANENLVFRRDKKSTKDLLHKVNLMRHEMMHFIRNLNDYVTSQVLEISWREFQDNLMTKVTCLDDLITMHEKYLNRALFRCLLNSKAAPVMKLVRDIFSSITKFSRLISMRMVGDEDENWRIIEAQYQAFCKYSRFFFSLVTKLAARGYQHHLEDLLIRLNFNGFYNRKE